MPVRGCLAERLSTRIILIPNRLMKKNLLKISALALLGFSVCGAACSADEKKEESKPAPAAKTATAALPNYRYVDLDTILNNYNLAKDYNEQMMRMQNNLESEARKHESSLQAQANQMQKKYQNNGYLSEEQFKNDQQRLNNMQADAQKKMGSLQQNFAETAEKLQKEVNDSIEAFIEDYNAKRGYDAIFFKAATLHINPALDITREVVDGLNARYNKVKK